MKLRKKRNKSKIGLLAVGLSVAMSLPAYAAEDSPVFQFDEVVVTAAGYEQSLVEAPASISVVTAEEINRRGYTDLAGILSDVEGVEVRGSVDRAGVTAISIRGLSEEYTLIMVDGIPINGDRAGGGTQYGSTVAGSYLPPMASIERVEVVRGPMSTLYGSNAMGGVVNIITKKVSDEWKHNLTTDYTVYPDSDRGTVSRWSLYSSGPLDDRLGLSLRGHWLRGGASDAVNGIVPNEGFVALRNYSIGSKLTWQRDDSNSFWLDVDKSVNDFSKSISTTMRQNPFRGDRFKWTLGSDNKVSYGDWSTTLTYNEITWKGYSNGDRTIVNDNLTFETKLVAPVGDAHMLTVGGSYWDQELTDPNYVTELGKATLTAKTTALFLEDDWRLKDDLTFTYGARYEHHDFFGGHVSPRGYLVWKASENWTLKGGVSSGYKRPTLAQSTDGRTGGSLGTDPNSVPTHRYGNSDLKPEETTNKELGFYYQQPGGLSANVTFFQTDFKNKIQSVDLESGTWWKGNYLDPNVNANYATYQNLGGKQEVKGVELSTKIPLAQNLGLNLSYTYTHNGDDGYRITNAPKQSANARLNWQADEKTSVWLRAEYRGKMLRYNTPNITAAQQQAIDRYGKHFGTYTLLDLGVSRKLSDSVTLNFAVNNLLNKDLSEHYTVGTTNYYKYGTLGQSSSGGAVLPGRNYWVSMNYNF